VPPKIHVLTLDASAQLVLECNSNEEASLLPSLEAFPMPGSLSLVHSPVSFQRIIQIISIEVSLPWEDFDDTLM
jgi:hypothetical protein